MVAEISVKGVEPRIHVLLSRDGHTGVVILAAEISSEGPVASRELHDFSRYEYKRIKAPY